jgi:hypothetical protein
MVDIAFEGALVMGPGGSRSYGIGCGECGGAGRDGFDGSSTRYTLFHKIGGQIVRKQCVWGALKIAVVNSCLP